MPNLLMNTIIRGMTEGVLGLLFTHPFDTVKTRLQTVGQIDFGNGEHLYTGAFDCFHKILKREGVTSLYKGFAVSFMCLIPTHLIIFLAYDLMTNRVFKNKELTTYDQIAVGFVTGALPTILTTPLENIKLKLQVPNGFFEHPSTIYWTVKGTMESEGILGFWRGLSLTILRDAHVCAVSCLLYNILTEKFLEEQMKSKELKKDVLEYIPFGICGGISGVISWLGAAPIDFMKTRFQSVPIGYYQDGLKDVIDHIREEASFRGISGFRFCYTGGKLVFLRAFFQSAAAFIGYEVYKELTFEKSLLELYKEEPEEGYDNIDPEEYEEIAPSSSDNQ